MAALTLTTIQSAFMTSMEQPFLDSFGDGIVLPGGTPPVIAGFKGFKDYNAEMKLNAINAIKSTFAPLVSLIVKEPGYVTVSTFVNGYASWGDANYGNGLVRYYKDVQGIVRVHGLLRTPPTGSVKYVTAFVLPAGFRPAPGDTRIFACTSEDAYMGIEVNANGNVTPLTVANNNAWISLELSFYAGG
jgi:hypothetical protein